MLAKTAVLLLVASAAALIPELHLTKDKNIILPNYKHKAHTKEYYYHHLGKSSDHTGFRKSENRHHDVSLNKIDSTHHSTHQGHPKPHHVLPAPTRRPQHRTALPPAHRRASPSVYRVQHPPVVEHGEARLLPPPLHHTQSYPPLHRPQHASIDHHRTADNHRGHWVFHDNTPHQHPHHKRQSPPAHFKSRT